MDSSVSLRDVKPELLDEEVARLNELANKKGVGEMSIDAILYPIFQTAMFKKVFGKELQDDIEMFTRSHSFEETFLVVDSVRKIGEVYPLIVDLDGYIIDGRSRFQAKVVTGQDKAYVKQLPIRCTANEKSIILCTLFALQIWRSKGISPHLLGIMKKVEDKLKELGINMQLVDMRLLSMYKYAIKKAERERKRIVALKDIVDEIGSKLVDDQVVKLAEAIIESYMKKEGAERIKMSLLASAALVAAVSTTCNGDEGVRNLLRELYYHGFIDNIRGAQRLARRMSSDLGLSRTVNDHCRERITYILQSHNIDPKPWLEKFEQWRLVTHNRPATAALVVQQALGLPEKDICEMFGITPPTFRNNRDKLFARGLITLPSSPQQAQSRGPSSPQPQSGGT
jgi:hypothetical protein